jgi:hypothetical protein
LQVADDVRTRLEGDIAELEGRLAAIEARLDEMNATLAIIQDGIETQVDMYTESNELIGRLLGRLAGALESLELADDLDGRRATQPGN